MKQLIQPLNLDSKNRWRAYRDLVELPDEGFHGSRLDRLAEKRKLSPAQIAAMAIEEFIEREEWRLSEIEAAVREADQDDFASDEDVAAVLSKYAGSPAGK